MSTAKDRFDWASVQLDQEKLAELKRAFDEAGQRLAEIQERERALDEEILRSRTALGRVYRSLLSQDPSKRSQGAR